MSDLEDLSMDDLLYASQSERKDGGEGDEDDEQPTTSSGGIPITVDRYACTQGTDGEHGSERSNATAMGLQAIAEADEIETAGYDSKALLFPSLPRRSSQSKIIPFSMPTASTAVRMGSSVPIQIGLPMMDKWNKEQSEDAASNKDGDEGFVPPHQISMQKENFISVAATSLRAGKDRLKARAAILRATGFVEQNMPGSPKTDRNTFDSLVSGGLSQALQRT